MAPEKSIKLKGTLYKKSPLYIRILKYTGLEMRVFPDFYLFLFFD